MQNTSFNFNRAATAGATVEVDFHTKKDKRIMPLHGVNSGPRTKSFVYDARPLFVEAGLPSVRLHDVEYPFGSGEYVDIPCVFKNFDADENDPASYNFALTDEYIRQCLAVGSKILYRLGISIEHAPVKRYTDPPKDFAKWARICEHIIRHYNEGWANGHEWNIRHWEIWNESDAESTKLWAGTQTQFIEFYSVAATYLKSCFPGLMIGGCGFTGSHPGNVERFIDALAKNRVPLDFLSFHSYADTPTRPVALWRRFREKLDSVGYTATETMLTEWNYMGSWDAACQPLYYPAMKDNRGGAFYAAMLSAMQRDTDLSLAHYFEADVVKEFCGIFDVDEMRVSIRNPARLKPTKGFYAFKAFNALYRMGDEVTVTENSDAPLYALAASGECGNGLLLANQEACPVKVELTLRNVKGDVAVRLTDALRTNETVKTLSTAEAQTFSLTLPPQSFAYIGTELADPIPTYEYDCYKGVSASVPKDPFFD